MDEVIKTNELPQVDALQDEDRVLVDTGAVGTGGMPYGAMVEQVKKPCSPPCARRLRLRSARRSAPRRGA